MRFLSFMYWNHIAYIIITIAMLGFAASGVFISIYINKLQKFPKHNLLSLFILGFSVSASLGLIVLIQSRISTSTFNIFDSYRQLLGLILIFTALGIPYFFAGAFITAIFTFEKENKGILYFFNLLGSGLGCIIFVLLIIPLGGPSLLFFICFCAIFLLIFGIELENILLKRVLLIYLFLLAFAMSSADSILILQPEATKGMALNYRHLPPQDISHELTLYNPTARMDVVNTDDEIKTLYSDADAWTPLFNVRKYGQPRDFPAYDKLKFFRAVYHVHPHPRKVLVIGSGGGADVLSAICAGASEVDAVDINSTTVDLVLNRYNYYLNGLFRLPGVTLYNLDGRTFLQRNHKKYDLGVMTGVDTYAAQLTGAYLLSESYLYTLEAFQDYVECLSDDGTFAISRCSGLAQPRELLRMLATALYALRNQGIPNPDQCVAFTLTTKSQYPWGTLIIRKKPFNSEQLKGLLEGVGPTYSEVLYAPFPDKKLLANPNNPFCELIEKFSQGQENQFFKNYIFKVFPVIDDQPFFFNFDRWSNILFKEPGLYVGSKSLLILLTILLVSILLSIIFVLLPLLKWQRTGFRLGQDFPWIVFFAGLGLGFMFIEMPLIQHFVLLLGHPAYSLGVTLPSILIFSGLGSLLSAKWSPKTAIIVGIIGLLGIGLFYHVFLGHIIESLIPLSAFIKILATLALIFPLAIFMGMFFQAGLRIVEQIHPPMIPWAFGVNGSCSVVGSVLGVIGSMIVGFKMIGLIALGFYLIAVLSLVISKAWTYKTTNTEAVS